MRWLWIYRSTSINTWLRFVKWQLLTRVAFFQSVIHFRRSLCTYIFYSMGRNKTLLIPVVASPSIMVYLVARKYNPELSSRLWCRHMPVCILRETIICSWYSSCSLVLKIDLLLIMWPRDLQKQEFILHNYLEDVCMCAHIGASVCMYNSLKWLSYSPHLGSIVHFWHRRPIRIIAVLHRYSNLILRLTVGAAGGSDVVVWCDTKNPLL